MGLIQSQLEDYHSKYLQKSKDYFRQEDLQILKEKYNSDKLFVFKKKKFATVKDILENDKLPVGEGSFGKVYKILLRDEEGPLYCALKIPNERKEKNLEKEIEILKSCYHENIVKLYGDYSFKRKREKKVLIFEYCSHFTLKKIIRKQELSLYQKKKIIYQILQAIEYLHYKRIFHGDIKPDNILIKDDKVKLVDFGNSLRIPLFKKDNNIDEEYLPPEHNFDDSLKYFSKDIWAFGVTAYEIICGNTFIFKNNLIKDLFIQNNYSFDFIEYVTFIKEDALANDFIKCCFFNNHKRKNAFQLLKHPFLLEVKSDKKENINISSDLAKIHEFQLQDEHLDTFENFCIKDSERTIYDDKIGKGFRKFFFHEIFQKSEQPKVTRSSGI